MNAAIFKAATSLPILEHSLSKEKARGRERKRKRKKKKKRKEKKKKKKLRDTVGMDRCRNLRDVAILHGQYYHVLPVLSLVSLWYVLIKRNQCLIEARKTEKERRDILEGEESDRKRGKDEEVPNH